MNMRMREENNVLQHRMVVTYLLKKVKREVSFMNCKVILKPQHKQLRLGVCLSIQGKLWWHHNFQNFVGICLESIIRVKIVLLGQKFIGYVRIFNIKTIENR